ncbi:MAG: FGLLP motif-containing membrane protein [Chloroflexota bacterium]
MKFVLSGLVGLVLAMALVTGASAQSYAPGDLFVAVGGGIVRVFDPSGAQVADLDTQTGSGEIGDMCFSNGAMYSMNFSDGTISKFDGAGNLLESRWATVDGGAIESCVLDSSGNLYVGEDGDVGGGLLKIDSSGKTVQMFSPDVVDSGTDQIDLASDQCTMYYTSESGAIKRFDVCANRQLDDFSSFQPSSSFLATNGAAAAPPTSCFGLRIRPSGEVLAACDVSVYRLNASGELIQRYDPPGVSLSDGGLFALNLDPDGKHVFTAAYAQGRIWRIDIDSGEGTVSPYVTTTIAGRSIGGLAVFGEITVAAPVSVIDPERPRIVQSVPDATDVATAPDVVGTNIALSVIVAIVILLTSQVFNETIEDNNAEIEGFVKRYVSPIASPFKSLGSVLGSGSGTSPGIALAVVLCATALVYGFLEPGFSLDKNGVILLISTVVALGAVTYVYSGIETRITEQRYHLPAGVRVYPVAFAIAIASVAVSRVIGFEPGVIYGFVASGIVLGVGELTAHQKGQAVFIAALALLATFGLAWAVMIPARSWAEHDANVLAVLLEASSTLVVVSAIESLTFSLVPLEFMHGMKIWRWSKAAWFGLTVASAFLFWEVLLFQDNAGFKSIQNGKSEGALIALGVCVAVTASVWAFFNYRRAQEAATPNPSPSLEGEGHTVGAETEESIAQDGESEPPLTGEG